jgi:hypothetical protein
MNFDRYLETLNLHKEERPEAPKISKEEAMKTASNILELDRRKRGRS